MINQILQVLLHNKSLTTRFGSFFCSEGWIVYHLEGKFKTAWTKILPEKYLLFDMYILFQFNNPVTRSDEFLELSSDTKPAVIELTALRNITGPKNPGVENESI